MSNTLKLAYSCAAMLLAGSPALAHVSLEKSEAARGTSYKAVIKVPHGCEGQATHTVRVLIPEGFIGVKPMPKAGWTIKTARGAYAQSYGYYHGPISEGVREITWSGGQLPDDYYDEFVAAGFIARELKDEALYFKVVQECDKGELNWSDVPSAGQNPHDLKAPAAILKIAAASGDHAGHDHGHADKGGTSPAAEEAASAKIGSIEVSGGFSRATAAGAKVGAGYLTLRNAGSEADTLVSIKTTVAGRGEIHDMTMTDEGVMRMRHLAEGIEIPAGGSVELKPGGKHLMFMELTQPLVAGSKVPVTLTFKSGATGEIMLPVRALGSPGAAKSDGESGHHHH